jgi:hypothetical protein
MRPNSRGAIGTSSGAPPGTGGMRRPGSGGPRLRTGVAPSGPGTQAAQGMAINASVNVSDRPVTGQGVKGMKAQGGAGGRLVYDSAFYVGLLRKKINDVNNETIKLRGEMDQSSRDNSQYVQLEKRYEALLKNKENLEGQLADYNLALDKVTTEVEPQLPQLKRYISGICWQTRTSTDPEDVQQMALHMAEKNRQAGQDLDRIFMQRKQREQETGQVRRNALRCVAKFHKSSSSIAPVWRTDRGADRGPVPCRAGPYQRAGARPVARLQRAAGPAEGAAGAPAAQREPPQRDQRTGVLLTMSELLLPLCRLTACAVLADSALRERREEQRAAQGVPGPGARAAGAAEGRRRTARGAGDRLAGPQGGQQQVHGPGERLQGGGQAHGGAGGPGECFC